MKILYYNWIQFDKRNNEGGGVSVYQKNIIEYLMKNTSNEIYFVSSGIYYDVFNKQTYIKETENIFGKKCRTFRIVNSKCVAPAKAMCKDIITYLNDETTYNIFKAFIKEHGEFDVIHFNNIEGLSSKCLQIKKDFPNTKVIFSIHNYFLFCPQVNLFYDDTKNCIDYENGKKCIRCLENCLSSQSCKKYYKIDGIFEKLHICNASKNIKSLAKKLRNRLNTKKEKNKKSEVNDEIYVKFRKDNVDNINKYVDVVLAVSQRVKNIAINMGINQEKIFTNYIGTAFAENCIRKLNSSIDNEYIKIAYMGYFLKIKGAEFLISALEKLPENIAKKIEFYCYAKKNKPEDDLYINRIEKLNSKLLKAEYHNGYVHQELPKILSNINLGIVPVIWEDNLPQVAIEYVAHGVPALCSNLGGASELCPLKEFIFEANNEKDFIDKLTNIVENKKILEKYFSNNIKLVTMEEHIHTLLDYYKEEKK